MRRLIAVVALLALAGCHGGERVPEFTEPVGENPLPFARWQLMPAGGGLTMGSAEIVPDAVEVSDDGLTLTVFFQGGNPNCYAVSGVSLERRDPDPPNVVVSYGTRLGVLGCTADLAALAIRLPLDPPFEP